MTTYRFVEGWSLPIDPQVAGETLATLAKGKGHLQPQMVVDASRPKRAPLHNYFEWDNKKAGELHRLDQASKLIRSVRVVAQEASETVLRRPFIHIPAQIKGTPSSYYPTATVMSSVDLRGRAIADALSYLHQAKSRLKEYRELEKEHSVIERVEQQLREKREKLVVITPPSRTAHPHV